MYVESEPGKAHLNKLKCGNRIQRGVHPLGDPEINTLKTRGNSIKLRLLLMTSKPKNTTPNSKAQAAKKAGNKQQVTQRKPARVIHQFREPVTRVTSTTKYMVSKRYTDKFGQVCRALTTAQNKYHQTILQILKLNRIVGIHLDLSNTTGNDASKYNTLYNDLFALELEISELQDSLRQLGKITVILEPSSVIPLTEGDTKDSDTA